MTILITGATGFVGSALCHTLELADIKNMAKPSAAKRSGFVAEFDRC